ncbi:hypothetical protein [Paractinoplanes abujensis]|uniref:Uncharacterized protein n=1 Tax=Paractinoplanes abujensis TaxID=882441 RepID=A0A7W7CPH9_9ACTN|nr:hypothetical protein [Actinoplanes abujensis]MBB4692337.1 hypothetical protein [Actinoplanes abujensis]
MWDRRFLGVLAAALVVAFVMLPPVVAAAWTGAGPTSHGQLVQATQQGFADYWRAGGGQLDAGLQRLVDYWFAFHVVKGVISALLLGTLVALAVPLWRSRKLVAAGVSGLAVVAAAAVMANVQGMLAPLSSLLPMAGEPTLAAAGRELSAVLSSGAPMPASLEPMVSDFGWYHAVMVPIAGVAVLILLATSVLLWRGPSRAGHKPARGSSPAGHNPARGSSRAGHKVIAGVTLTLALVMGVVVTANATTAADPAPALLAFFQGGW